MVGWQTWLPCVSAVCRPFSSPKHWGRGAPGLNLNLPGPLLVTVSYGSEGAEIIGAHFGLSGICIGAPFGFSGTSWFSLVANQWDSATNAHAVPAQCPRTVQAYTRLTCAAVAPRVFAQQRRGGTNNFGPDANTSNDETGAQGMGKWRSRNLSPGEIQSAKDRLPFAEVAFFLCGFGKDEAPRTHKPVESGESPFPMRFMWVLQVSAMSMARQTH